MNFRLRFSGFECSDSSLLGLAPVECGRERLFSHADGFWMRGRRLKEKKQVHSRFSHLVLVLWLGGCLNLAAQTSPEPLLYKDKDLVVDLGVGL